MDQLQTTNSQPALRRAPADPTSLRPFRYTAPEAELIELRRRVAATRWPEKETIGDDTQGVQLATMGARDPRGGKGQATDARRPGY